VVESISSSNLSNIEDSEMSYRDQIIKEKDKEEHHKQQKVRNSAKLPIMLNQLGNMNHAQQAMGKASCVIRINPKLGVVVDQEIGKIAAAAALRQGTAQEATRRMRYSGIFI
jgi:hypothetical protein